jgi:hypothetical protein
MKLLRNFENACLYFNIESSIVLNITNEPNIIGWYKVIDNSKCGILVENHNLYLFFDDIKILIAPNFIAKITNSEKPNYKFFTLFDHEKEILKFEYDFKVENIDDPITSFMSQNDFDWGVFIVSILNDPEKKKNFITNILEQS